MTNGHPHAPPSRWRAVEESAWYERLNLAATLVAVFAAPVAGLIASLAPTLAPSLGQSIDPHATRRVVLAIEAGCSLVFLCDIAIGWKAQGRSYLARPAPWVNFLAILSVAAEVLIAGFGVANARILRALRTVRIVARIGLLMTRRPQDSVLGAEALRRMNDNDTWFALALLLLLSGLGHFHPLDHAAVDDFAIEIAIYGGFFLAVRAKGYLNERKIEEVFIGRLRDANQRVIDRMREIPGLGDAHLALRERAAELARGGKAMNEIDVMVESVGMIMANLRRFISHRTFREAKGEQVLSPERPVALLFTDVEGFSRIAAAMRTGIVPVLQRYFGAMSDGVHTLGGDIDKFIGDAVFAYFDDPADPRNAANKAFDAVIAMTVSCDAMQEAENGWHALFDGHAVPSEQRRIRTRFGLHWGTVLAGPIGSDRRADSTLVGDAVNLAARMESANKHYGSYCLMTQSLYEHLSPDRRARCRLVDRVTVQGREHEPLAIFVLDFAPVPSGLREAFSAGVEAYLSGDWQSAHAALLSCREHVAHLDLPPDGPTEALL
ncbi:MAG: adenylate/guanylate cyclase domain-containing protein, partial [Alphaproteobacteria bacterium]|nr:adenylate/guanylate cyclase domain-containing protein [Alphaproteobacteria bacterium]